MGGCEGGEIAARILASSFLENSDGWNISTKEAAKKIQAVLKNAVIKISETEKLNPSLSCMGAAIAGLVLCPDSVLIFNCGDCRTYYQRGEYLERLSRDHSVVEELRARGEIDDDTMRTHPLKNQITACISSQLSNMDIYFREISRTDANQKFFICSDGVWEALPIEDIEKCFLEAAGYKTANLLVKKLIEAKNNCHDNISFIIV